MKLRQIELAGFGKLVNKVYEFGPGLNLIYGRNEAGKSTLQRSIFAALYGFFDNGTITAAKKSALAAYEPWDTEASFGVKLLFEVDRGAQYRVERNFLPKPETILYNLTNGKTVSKKFPAASHGRLFFAEELLGMSREVFESTSLVRQAELAMLEKSASAITDTLLRLSASASQESTVSQALEIIETILKEQIGTPRSRNKPLPEAQRRLNDLQAAQTQLRTEYLTLANQMHELAQVEEGFEMLRYERDKAEFLHLLARRLTTQQERLTIQQADNEVGRCQQDVSKYQAWSAFPADNQPKIYRLSAQLEKARGYSEQAAQVAHRAIQRFAQLYTQLNEVRKGLNGTNEPSELLGLETQSAAIVSTAVNSWLGNEFSTVDSIIQERQNDLQLKAQNLERLLHVGHEGLNKARQELRNLESDVAQAKEMMQQTQQRAKQVGLPEDRWEEILSEAQADVEGSKAWSEFPVHLRDELLQLTAQYFPLHQNLAGKSRHVTELENKLNEAQKQIESLLQQVSELENIRSIPHQEKLRIQEIASQLDIEKQAAADTRRRFVEVDHIYRQEQQALELERQAAKPLENLEVYELTHLQQLWLHATWQLASVQPRFNQAELAWNGVGMPVAEFQHLEKTVKEIQSGVRPVPKPRRGCRSWFTLKPTREVDQAPSEITIYSQIQPIYSEFIRQRDEVAEWKGVSHSIEDQLRQKLGPLIPATIQENTFTDLLHQLRSHHEKVSQAEKHKEVWNSHQSQYQQAENRVRQIENRLGKELQSFGVAGRNTDAALLNFFRACEQKERLVAIESSLEGLKSQDKLLRHELEQFQVQQQTLSRIEEKITNLLAKANIDIESRTIQEGMRQFNDGLERYHHWRETQSSLERIQKQIDEQRQQLSDARSVVGTKEEALFKFREQLVEKLSGLLNRDFSDQNLAQLNSDLNLYNSAKSEIDKVQGQIEQLQLQAQAIQRDLDDWAEKEQTAEQLENEILQAIQAADIQTDQLSVETALRSFDESFQSFLRWQNAKRALDSAVLVQQHMQSNRSKLENEYVSIETKITEALKQHPEWKNLTIKDGPEVYEQNVTTLNQQLLQERDRLIRLQDTVSRSASNLRHLAELEEEIDLINREIQELNTFARTLEIAGKELAIAAQEFQKVFAPQLEQVVEHGLQQITKGRYQKARIDSNSLSVQVLAPEQNDFVETAQLSTGTRDLIYLVLRIGITELMSKSGEKLPLLLDDPLVEFDAVRQKACLEYLEKLSDRTQILFFTKDEDIKDWFHNRNHAVSNSRLVELI